MLTSNFISTPCWYPTYKSPAPEESIDKRNETMVEDDVDEARASNEVCNTYLNLLTIQIKTCICINSLMLR